MPIILNKSELATSELRKNALEILEAGLEAVNTQKILKNKLSVKDRVLYVKESLSDDNLVSGSPPLWGGVGGGASFNLQSFNHLIFIGIGKCALDGAKVMEDILGEYLTGGAVIDVKPATEVPQLKKIRYFEGTHPLPSEQNISATKEILKLTENLNEKDLVITLISGGGSALFDLPDEAATAKLGLPGETSLETIKRITKELTAKGADIYELNEARKKMSKVKGGKFAEHCFPAKVISIIFSDVLGNDISVIASGPTVLENDDHPSLNVREGSGVSYKNEIRVSNILIASNHDALIAMKNKAEKLGFNTKIETETLSGNAAEVGKELAIRELKPKSCILFGGETTVKINENHGKGGRNQELALSALLNIKKDSLIASIASDGFDNTDHAGAMADAELLEKAKQINLSPEEFLERSDSYNFFKKLNDGAIYTGKLESNVSDLCIIIYE